MTLTPCSDLSPADWITTSDVPWIRLATFGPAGFPAYARMRVLPDPSVDGQSENEVAPDAIRTIADEWPPLFERLGRHTSTPDDCYFALWNGWAGIVPQGPLFEIPNRSYFLFHGSLTEPLNWGDAAPLRGSWSRPEEPAFVWPADHAWCVTNDVDPHWAGIGASGAAIEALTDDSRLDVVRADPAARQPFYR